ncbi:MAG: SCO family protein [Candidatus Rokubacteria bacterium]|nr:SCO family protein [Candidatus Rokubacteria bacterium]
MRASRFPAILVVLWLASVAVWWGLAFMPLPSEPPEWLTAARYACFGPMEDGWPEAYGWMLLVLAPASFLIAIGVLWGSEIGPSLRDLARSHAGRCVLAVVVLAVAVEGAWVARKVLAARAVAEATQAVTDDGALPEHYPRGAAIARDFALVDQHGATASLARRHGRPVIVSFVFGHCRTMCPLIVETLKRVPADGGLEVLLVSLDPWRDTPSALPAIARGWQLPAHMRILTGRRPADVLAVADAYGVAHERDEKTGDITHPGLVFVIDAEGRVAYTFNNPSAAWVREALTRVNETFTRVNETFTRIGPTHARRG